MTEEVVTGATVVEMITEMVDVDREVHAALDHQEMIVIDLEEAIEMIYREEITEDVTTEIDVIEDVVLKTVTESEAVALETETIR